MQLHDTAYLSSRLFITVFLSYRIMRYPTARRMDGARRNMYNTPPSYGGHLWVRDLSLLFLSVFGGNFASSPMEWHWLWTAGLVCDWFLSQLEQLLFG
jgi:hypothetical protein